MIVLPQLAYIGHAFLNYTIHNSLSPSITPRGTGFYDTFTSGYLSFYDVAPTTPPTIAEIEAFESNLPTAPVTIDIIPGGGDYFNSLPSGYFELDTNAAGTVRESGKLVRLTAKGFIKINAKVQAVLGGVAEKSMEFGETEFWEPVTVDTGDAKAKWMNEKMILTQGRLLVNEASGRAYGMELRLFMMINGQSTSTTAPTQTATDTSVKVTGTATTHTTAEKKRRRANRRRL